MNSWSIFDFSRQKFELERMEKESENQEIWNNPAKAQELMKKISDLREDVEGWTNLEEKTNSLLEIAESGDDSFKSEIEGEISQLTQELNKRELGTYLSGPYDKGNAILSITSGAGGTESCDWAAMLERMYLRWIEKKGFHSEIWDQTEGEEAGIKSVTISVTGKYAYGYLHAEKGVHRLVRLSPFDAAHRRHTSFAQIEVLPEATQEDPVVQINPDDLKIDIYRSSGAGGQNVQKNSTAIRITHIPTGIVVSCQNERSQIQNRENALRVLRARLLDIYREEKEKELEEIKGVFVKTEWGSQIRSYVLHPYQMVKDHRTEHETSNTSAVLDGEIDGFIEAYLRSKRKE